MDVTSADANGRPAPISTIDMPWVAFAVELDRPAFRPGELVTGRVRIRNDSLTDRLRLDIGRRRGVTLHRDGTRAGGLQGAAAGAEATVRLAPDSESTIGFIGGSYAIDSSTGPFLPAGRYLIVVSLQVYGDGRVDEVVTPPVDLILEN